MRLRWAGARPATRPRASTTPRGVVRVGTLGGQTAAALFVVRSEDFVRLSEADLDIARSFADYAASHRELPWELIFVTRQGSFKASELLQLPGLPVFERCAFRTVADIPN